MKRLLRTSLLLFALLIPLPSPAQDPTAKLAGDLANRIVASGKDQVIVSTRFLCKKKCGGLGRQIAQQLQSALFQARPPFRILSQPELELLLREHDFQPIDYYGLRALRYLAEKTGAVFVSGSIKETRKGLEVEVELHDGPSVKPFYKTRYLTPVVSVPEEPKICDPVSGVCLSGSGGISLPTCRSCPNPDFPKELFNRWGPGSVLVLLTVTSQGGAADVVLLRGLGKEVDEKVITRVRSWQFKPAQDENGTPLATRMTVEVTFRW